MQISQLPTRMTTAFAASASGSYKRTIPVPSQQSIIAGAASMTDGFPPITFLPTTSGGIPPAGQDFNGILNAITTWTRWQAAGGTVPFDQIFADAVGGYPYGAIVQSTTSGKLWLNTADGNATNPDGGSPANWLAIAGGTGAFIGPRFITVSGTYIPTAGTNRIIAIATGGGAGGGGSYNHTVGGGGGAGATAWKFITSPASMAATIGVGGTAGAGVSSGSRNGTAGGTTSLGSVLSAGGGQPTTDMVGQGSVGAATEGGQGGVATLGDLLIPGGDGHTAVADSAGTTALMGMSGGASFWGGGGGVKSYVNGEFGRTGRDGQVYGSGGGGGGAQTGSYAYPGGAGKAGVIVILEFA